MRRLLSAILAFPLIAFSQQQTGYIFCATSDQTFTWYSPATLKTNLGLANVNGTWGDSTRANLYTTLATKQTLLVSGTNIKTVNGNSIVGSGDISLSAGFAWGNATGTLSNQTDLQNALNAKQNTITPGSSAQYVRGDLTLGNYTGYTLSVQALTSSPTDAQTIFFGNLPKVPVTAAATSKILIRKAGTIKMAEIYCFSGTAGTSEAWVMSIRLNNTTDTQIASLSVSASERIFSNTALSIPVVAGDYIEIKCVNPTWVTNPLTTIFGGYIYIE